MFYPIPGSRGPKGNAGTTVSNFRTEIAALSPSRWYKCINPGNGNTETDFGSDGQNGTWSSSGSSIARGMILGQSGNAAFLDGSAGRLDMPTTGLPTGSTHWSVIHVFSLYDKSAGGTHAAWGLGDDGTANHGGFALDWSSTLLQANNNPSFLTIGWADVAMLNSGIYVTVVEFDGTNVILYINGRFVFSSAAAVNLAYGKASIGSNGIGTPAEFAKIVSADWVMVSGTVLTAAQIYDLYSSFLGN